MVTRLLSSGFSLSASVSKVISCIHSVTLLGCSPAAEASSVDCFRGVDKLLYVIERRLGLGGAFQLVGAYYAAGCGRLQHHFVGSGVRGGLLQVAYELDEFDYLVESARFDPQLVGTRRWSNVCHMLAFFSAAHAAMRSIVVGPMPRAGTLIMRLIASSSSGLTMRAYVGEYVLDLGALVERQPSVYLVGYAGRTHGVFEHTRLRVGTVEHRYVAGCSLCIAACDLMSSTTEKASCLSVSALISFMGSPSSLREKLSLRICLSLRLMTELAALLGGTGGAVVLFQLEKGGAFVVFGEAEYVLYFGSAERIYALGVVAHHAYVSASGRKLLYYKILREVGVLILVH